MNLRRVQVRDSEQIATLAQLANEIYHEYFITIITKEQIDYMVDLFLSEEALTKAIHEEGYVYCYFTDNGDPVSFYGVKPAEDDLFLSKLYVRKDYRGRGVGRAMLEDLSGYCLDRGLASIWLTCNKYNKDTLASYDRWGFVIEDDVVTDIGGGFVMDDYILRAQIPIAKKNTATPAANDAASASALGADGSSRHKKDDEGLKDQRYEFVSPEDLAKLPRINLGALFMPALWGPVNGYWITILLYPVWIFVDSCIRSSVLTPNALHIILATISLLVTLGFTVYFSLTCEPGAFIRRAKRVDVDTYLKRQKIWAVICFVILVAAVILATWYNLTVYLPANM